MKKLVVGAMVLILVSINIFPEDMDSMYSDLNFPDSKNLAEVQKFIEKIAPFDAKPEDLIDRYGVPEKVLEEKIFDSVHIHYYFENAGEFIFSEEEILMIWIIEETEIKNLNIPFSNKMEVLKQFGKPDKDYKARYMDFGDRVFYRYDSSELYIYFNEDETLRKICWTIP